MNSNANIPSWLKLPSSASEKERMASRALNKWNIPDDVVVVLLGGQAERQSRVDMLLAIYGLLHSLYPHNPELADAWPQSPNKHFDSRTPVKVMADGGLPGMQSVLNGLCRIGFG